MTTRVSALLSAIKRTEKSLAEATGRDLNNGMYPEHVPDTFGSTFADVNKFIFRLKQNPATSEHADVLKKLQDAAVKRMADGGEAYQIARDAYFTHFNGLGEHVRALKRGEPSNVEVRNKKLYSNETADAILALLNNMGKS